MIHRYSKWIVKRINASRKGFKEGASESDKQELEKQLKREKSGSKEGASESTKQELRREKSGSKEGTSESTKQELEKLASLEFYICTSCLEQFPNLAMSANSTECARCGRDKRIPKL